MDFLGLCQYKTFICALTVTNDFMEILAGWAGGAPDEWSRNNAARSKLQSIFEMMVRENILQLFLGFIKDFK